MQLTGGQYKGIKLNAINGTRPTLSNVREAVFSILSSYIASNNSFFLDGFSGSGIMALEAKSRGYNVLAIDVNPKTVKNIKINFKKLNLCANVVLADFLKFISGTNQKFDVIYLDPPWNNDYNLYIEKSIEHLTDSGFLIIESDKKNNLDFSIFQNVEIFKDKFYGRARITFLKLT